jgi:crossover junction endodeoxyribonuclease RusA
MVLQSLNRRAAESVYASGETQYEELQSNIGARENYQLLGPLCFPLSIFYDSGSMDIDNLPKPISDALKGLVYLDDEQVTDIVCHKRNLNHELRVENPSLVLAEGFSRGNQFLYIIIEEAPDQEVIY